MMWCGEHGCYPRVRPVCWGTLGVPSWVQPDMEQQTSSKLGKEYDKTVYCQPASLTYMQSTSCEMPGWMKLKLESRKPGEIPITSDMQMKPPLWQKAKRN